MFKRMLWAVVTLYAFTACTSEKELKSTEYSAELNDRFTGELAYETVDLCREILACGWKHRF